ncbi:NADH-ubiquinone oxidoreductase 78 kDa subunit, mitochondrial [uncultured Alphaproteobacteria bacterium]|uniref:NADH-quinone oxidoreductase n=1 Tax=uncultured Alphaproteobacteria bacterium TaxID=91750 RepID=A0A212J8T7_9PROT|nr:NADH-ubiquinone oxidoreductase 78 kDa subunit, mitochondrial [uncultured Alphaproteobacteria bacterium]
MPKLTIDGMEVEVPAGTSVLQAAEQLGIEIPRFCYHERLPVAANCRMCLVEIEKMPKPVASCAMPTGEGMVVRTQSEAALQARKNVMELLLINHPLDCPICDQGGECDLQDQAMAYGRDKGRYDEEKRAVTEKYLGPLVKTAMTRCIHCTRCVRFLTEIAGVPELGMTFRGEHAEITTYIEHALTSELSGNIVDLCPVGALTSKPYAFSARPWELRKTLSYDVFDAVGCAIRVDTRGNQVMRVLPRTNEDVNEEWLADKSRHAIDGLTKRRLDVPYVRRDGKLEPATWNEAFAAIREAFAPLAGPEIAALAGDMADAEAMFALKLLVEALGSANLDCRQDGAALDPAVPVSYRFNTTIAGIEAADAILIVGSNPRIEAPVLNARIRKRVARAGIPVGVIGPDADLTYRTQHLGGGADTLQAILDGINPFADVLAKAERPMIVLGMGALTRADGARVLGAARALAEKTGMVKDGWNGFNVLHTAAARVGGLDLGFVPGPGGKGTREILAAAANGDIKAVWLLGADQIETNGLDRAFVVYQGHHGDVGAQVADVILPGAAYTEKSGTYVNTEGRVQRALRAAFPPGEAREDWKILRAASEVLGHTLPFDSLEALRARLAEHAPSFAVHDVATPGAWAPFGEKGPLDASAGPFVSPIRNYYMTDPISRASPTMQACTVEILGETNQARTGTDG